jgi:hypothetical protein
MMSEKNLNRDARKEGAKDAEALDPIARAFYETAYSSAWGKDWRYDDLAEERKAAWRELVVCAIDTAREPMRAIWGLPSGDDADASDAVTSTTQYQIDSRRLDAIDALIEDAGSPDAKIAPHITGFSGMDDPRLEPWAEEVDAFIARLADALKTVRALSVGGEAAASARSAFSRSVAPLDPDAKRTPARTQKVETPFGPHYIHVDTDVNGRIVDASISTPRKDPDATVGQLIAALSAGLSELAQSIAADAAGTDSFEEQER